MRLRTILIVVAVVVLLPLAALGVFLATFDPNAYKPQIIAAARNATGRELRLSGPIQVKPSLVPTITVEDAGFANAPWGSRPEMATMKRLEARIALLPLIRGELRIAKITLVEPDILLERQADGQANWVMHRPAGAAAPSAPAPATGGAPSTPRGSAIAVEAISIQGGRVALRDALLNRTQSLAIASAEASASGGDGPLRLDAKATWNGIAFTAAIKGGPLAQLMDPAAGGPPWPIDLRIEADGARLAAKGTIASPVTGAGYDLAVEGSIDQLIRLAALVPDVPLPPLRGVSFAVQAADKGGAFPELRALSLKVGESDLNALQTGLVLRSAEVNGKAADQPLSFAAQATLSGVLLKAEGGTGPLAALLPGAASTTPWPIRLVASAGDATLSVDGALSHPTEAAGLDAKIEARVPDLAALSPLAGQPLPAVRDATFSARLVEHDRRNGYALKDISARALGSDIEGEASLLLAARSRIEARLASRKLDVDALLAAMPAPPPAASAGAPASAPPPTPPDGRIIPNTPLPLELLKPLDAKATLAVAELVFGATAYRDVGAEIALASGHLQVKDLKATLSSGRLSGALDVDAGKDVPPVAIMLRSPAQELASLLPRLGVPFPMRGQMELDLNVTGAGATPRAIAASLGGHLGVAVGRGSIDSRLLEMAAGELWRVLVPGAPRGDTSITCIALRFDIAHGVAVARTLLADTAPARISGEGNLNLGTERLALVLTPTLRLAGGGISVPVDVGGSFAHPSYRPNPLGTLGALGGLAGGAAAGAGQGAAIGGPLGAIVGGIVGATRQGAGDAGDDCPAALASARGAAAPAAAPSQPAPSSSPRSSSPIPGLRLPRLPF